MTMGSFDQLIQQWNKPPVMAGRTGIELVAIHNKSGRREMQPQWPWWRFSIFTISHAATALRVKGPELKIPYQDAENPVRLQLYYDACIAGPQIIPWLTRVPIGSSLPELVNSWIEAEAGRYIFETPDFIENYDQRVDDFIRRIADAVKRRGLEIRLHIQTNMHRPCMEYIQIHRTVSATSQDGRKVELAVLLEIALSDRIRFSISGVPDLVAWTQQQLAAHAQVALKGISYADVYQKENHPLLRILLHESLRTVGYAVVKINIVLERFQVSIPNGGVLLCNTAHPFYKEKLQIAVRGKFDLTDERTKQLIEDGEDLLLLVCAKLSYEARSYFEEKTVSECLYQQQRMGADVEQYLVQRLTDDIGLDTRELELQVKYTDNSLLLRRNKLMGQAHQITFRTEMGARKYALSFRVLDIAPGGWERFLQNGYKTAAEEWMALAKVIGREMGPFISAESCTEAEIQQRFESLLPSLQREFGLIIALERIAELKGAVLSYKLGVADRWRQSLYRQELQLIQSREDLLKKLLREDLEDKGYDEEQKRQRKRQIDHIQQETQTYYPHPKPE